MIRNSIGNDQPISRLLLPFPLEDRTEGMILDVKFETGRFVVDRFTYNRRTKSS